MNLKLTAVFALSCSLQACSGFAIKPSEESVQLPLLAEIWTDSVNSIHGKREPGKMSAPELIQTIDVIAAVVESDTVSTIGLQDAIAYAQKADYVFKVVLQNHEVSVKDIGIARTRFYPDIKGEAAAAYDRTDGMANTTDTGSQSLAITLNQPIYNKFLAASFNEALLKKSAADAAVQVAYDDLITRVVNAFTAVVKARSDLNFRQLDLESIQEQVAESRRLFEFGSVTSTDIAEITAQRDQALAARINADRVHTIALEDFSAITGLPADTKLAQLDLSLPLTEPSPDSADHWAQLAIDNSRRIQAGRKNADAAARRVTVERASRFPTVGLNGSVQKAFGTEQASDEDYRANISLNMAVPIFDGGRIGSTVAREQAAAAAAVYQAESARIDEVRKVRGLYHDVISSIQTVNALKQALSSNQAAIDAVEAGFRFGTRTALEVLRTRRSALQSRTLIENSTWDYVQDSLLLNLSAGVLSSKKLEQISQWLLR